MKKIILLIPFAALATIHVASSIKAQERSVKAFTDLRLIDGTNRAPISNATILVSDGRIVAAGAASSVTIPAGAQRIPLNGKSVIPGLINAHGHVNNPERDLKTYAAYGVTTVFSLGGENAAHIAARDTQSSSSLNRARIFAAGPVLTPRTPEEAREMGADFVALDGDPLANISNTRRISDVFIAGNRVAR